MNPVYVHGAAVLTDWANARLNLGEFIFRGVTAALADARLAMSEMDSIVLAAHDLVDGRSLSSMVTSPPAGAYLKDEIRLSEDGLAALSLGALRIVAGESKFGIVAAWGRASEGDYGRISRTTFDPFAVQPLGFDEFSVSSLRLNCWLSSHEGDQTKARSKRRERALANPRRPIAGTPVIELGHPFKPGDAPHLCDTVVAVIIGETPASVRVAQIGHGTEPAALGDRDLSTISSVAQAFEAAGGTGRAFDIYELDGATLSDEAFALEAIGVAEPGRGFAAYADDPRFNPSGGGAAGWSYPTNGLRRLAEAFFQLRGSAGPVQLTGPLQSAIVTGLSPVGAQVATAVVLEAA